ncbi:MAG: outer membrane beta-barrel protein [Flavobacteriales bacterium]|nr:outer membrane beta-barrel protein [Flavobacteriales bacterium]
MRLRTLALLSSLVFGVVSHAQSAGIGIKGGALVSTVKALHLRATPIPGATAGIYVPWGFASLWEIQPEALVTALGANFTEPDGDRSTVRSIYFQMPVVLKKYVNNQVNFCLGYQFGKVLAAQEQREDATMDVTEHFNALDMGFVGGAGLDLDNGLDLSLRAYSSMTPAYVNDNAVFPKHRSVQFTIGYRVLQFKASRRHHRRG